MLLLSPGRVVTRRWHSKLMRVVVWRHTTVHLRVESHQVRRRLMVRQVDNWRLILRRVKLVGLVLVRLVVISVACSIVRILVLWLALLKEIVSLGIRRFWLPMGFWLLVGRRHILFLCRCFLGWLVVSFIQSLNRHRQIFCCSIVVVLVCA